MDKDYGYGDGEEYRSHLNHGWDYGSGYSNGVGFCSSYIVDHLTGTGYGSGIYCGCGSVAYCGCGSANSHLESCGNGFNPGSGNEDSQGDGFDYDTTY